MLSFYHHLFPVCFNTVFFGAQTVIMYMWLFYTHFKIEFHSRRLNRRLNNRTESQTTIMYEYNLQEFVTASAQGNDT